MEIRARLCLLTITAAALVAGCGSATSAPPGASAPPASGAALFATHCLACHSLSGNPRPRQQGGDLADVRLPRRELLQYAAEMPVIHGRMSARELRAVVAYVASVEHR